MGPTQKMAGKNQDASIGSWQVMTAIGRQIHESDLQNAELGREGNRFGGSIQC